MIRAGTVNIDTSHPLGFGEAMERSGRMRFVGVYNDSFRSDTEVEGFMRRFGLEARCGTIGELADMCDVGFIQGCDWDDHIRCAMPFIERGKPVFIDKPMAGSLRDVRRLRELSDMGARILGASSARYSFEIRELKALSYEERGDILSVSGTSGVDDFNYGIHIVEAIGGVLEGKALSVRYMGRAELGTQYAESYFISFSGGRSAVYTVQTGVWQPFTLTVLTTTTTYQLRLDPERLYDALIEELADELEGKGSRIACTDKLMESVEIMLAGLQSRENGGEEVALDSLAPDGPSFDGRGFWKCYAAAAKPVYAGL